MAVLALDLGTTKICALVMDEERGAVLETRHENNAFLPGAAPWSRIQDPEKIFTLAGTLVSCLLKKYGAFRCIGISCQMHGILYVDSRGRAISPLFTWQDMSASLPFPAKDGESYASYLAKFSPGPMAPGYGLSTLFYHLVKKEIPPGAVKICTIGDYVAMRLSGSALPAMHATNAGGMGFFDLHKRDFDKISAERAGIDVSLLPRVVPGGEVVGEFSGTTPVCAAIGDNQASFLGSVEDSESSILVNIGTGSQISLVSSRPENSSALEARPFFENKFLLVGASLCGGRAYAILEGFFRQVIEMAGLSAGRPLYDVMDESAIAVEDAAKGDDDCALAVNTLFAGTRRDPSRRGSILNISEDNFTPARLASGFLHGAAKELYDFYLPMKGEGGYHRLIGAGNGIRKSRPLKRILPRIFDMPLEIPLNEEEAAYGAALFALSCTGYFKTTFQAQRLVKYEEAPDNKSGRP